MVGMVVLSNSLSAYFTDFVKFPLRVYKNVNFPIIILFKIS